MKPEPRLHIESVAGGPINQYRIVDNAHVEFRSLDAAGSRFPDERSAWRKLTADEILMHFTLNTVVAEWLTARLTRVARAA
jgi:hypothetical protein